MAAIWSAVERRGFRVLNRFGIGLRIRAFNLYNAALASRRIDMRKSAAIKAVLPRAPAVMDPKIGVAKVDRGSLPYTEEVLAAIDAIWAEDRQMPQATKKKSYLRNILNPDRIASHPMLMKFASSPEIAAIVADYLGEIPALSEIQLWISEDDSPIERGSQMYHRDTADETQVKLFFLGNDVELQSGPLHVLPREISQAASKRLRYWTRKAPYYVPDPVLFDGIDPVSAIACTGEKGTAYFADTSQCFHFGSRDAKKPRCILMLQYTRLGRGDLRGEDFHQFRDSATSEAGRLLLDRDYMPRFDSGDGAEHVTASAA